MITGDALAARTHPKSGSRGGVGSELLDTCRSAVVTGVAGFIGSHLAEALLKHGVLVVGLDCRASGDTSVLANL